MILPEHLSYLCLKCICFLCGLFIFELPMKYFFSANTGRQQLQEKIIQEGEERT